MHLLLSELPRVIFVGPNGSEISVDLSREGQTIARLAELIDATFPRGCSLGLVFQSKPELILSWFAVVSSGREPLILQYPTPKQTAVDWRHSVENTAKLVQLDGVLVSDSSLAWDADLKKLIITPDTARKARHEATTTATSIELTGKTILQLSSGTTGHRKAIRFSFDQVQKHLDDYASVILSQTRDDCIVSWLPLYHDMGFVACFLLPLFTKTRLIMIDPIDWVSDPPLLYRTIAAHSGTICFMPNFAFEVMARHRLQQPLTSMRRWISCSEPVYAATMRRFKDATGSAADSLQACYALAENVFAVTQSESFKTVMWNNEERVSCGFAIPNCDVKLVDNQIYVKSPSSIGSYVNGPRVSDSDGYFATGDLGALTPNGLLVLGRIHDLINVAGRKYLLNDLDGALREVMQQVGGRATTTVHRDGTSGTEQPVFFAETDSLLLRRREEAGIRELICARTGISTARFHFVPDWFITKTSSGKVNRAATLAHWYLKDNSETTIEHSLAARSCSFTEAVREHFGDLPYNKPLVEILDSLGLTQLHLLAERYDLAISATDCLTSLRQQETRRPRSNKPTNENCFISIIALADSRVLSSIDQVFAEKCSLELGIPIVFESLCLPPLPVLQTDLLFHDFLRCRDNQGNYSAVAQAMRKLKNASLVILDDTAELGFPLEQIYPVLDNRFRRASDADLLAYRWQQYTQHHHTLPLSLVRGADLNCDRNALIEAFSEYIGAPFFTIATLNHFTDVTRSWHFVDRRFELRQRLISSPPGLPDVLLRYLKSNRNKLRVTKGIGESKSIRLDLPHFCSWYLDKDKIDEILASFESFCIIGSPSSVFYITKRLSEMQKPFFFTNTLNLGNYAESSFQCVLMTGSWGPPRTTKPVFQLFFAGFPDPSGLSSEHFAHRDLVHDRRNVERSFFNIHRPQHKA
jgi:acyl-CoA synthetase (AMP-forming)/AMP-acid ligase II